MTVISCVAAQNNGGIRTQDSSMVPTLNKNKPGHWRPQDNCWRSWHTFWRPEDPVVFVIAGLGNLFGDFQDCSTELVINVTNMTQVTGNLRTF